MICKICCDDIDKIYKFRIKCLISKTSLIDFMAQIKAILNNDLSEFNLNDDQQEEIKEKLESTLNSPKNLNLDIKTEDVIHEVTSLSDDETLSSLKRREKRKRKCKTSKASVTNVPESDGNKIIIKFDNDKIKMEDIKVEYLSDDDYSDGLDLSNSDDGKFV